METRDQDPSAAMLALVAEWDPSSPGSPGALGALEVETRDQDLSVAMLALLELWRSLGDWRPSPGEDVEGKS